MRLILALTAILIAPLAPVDANAHSRPAIIAASAAARKHAEPSGYIKDVGGKMVRIVGAPFYPAAAQDMKRKTLLLRPVGPLRK
ncbi:hypothetical protein Rleg5DRAFT_1632 [Rhizobium leguminosarum bv. viciae WSM1455]|jgi:hypothetical protein|nr:hypothetical protein Rleg5DRAFT_1632 [Rhizobium leguminosarum bv. viciae WSM1455]